MRLHCLLQEAILGAHLSVPHRMVGSHRRIALEDLLSYAQNMRAQQASALERLAMTDALMSLACPSRFGLKWLIDRPERAS